MVIKPFLLLGLAAEYRLHQITTVDAINIAADQQMFMTLTGELSWQYRRRSAVDFYSKNEKIALWATPSGLRGNIRTPSIAHWKARGRLYICHNLTFFASSYGWDVISGNLSKSALLEGGGSLWVQISEGRECLQPTTVGVRCQSSRVIALSCGIKISAVHHLVVSQYTRLTDIRIDGRTDGQNCDSNTVRCITCSRTVKISDVTASYL